MKAKAIVRIIKLKTNKKQTGLQLFAKTAQECEMFFTGVAGNKVQISTSLPVVYGFKTSPVDLLQWVWDVAALAKKKKQANTDK